MVLINCWGYEIGSVRVLIGRSKMEGQSLDFLTDLSPNAQACFRALYCADLWSKFCSLSVNQEDLLSLYSNNNFNIMVTSEF